jgi:hypothetical protein
MNRKQSAHERRRQARAVALWGAYLTPGTRFSTTTERGCVVTQAPEDILSKLDGKGDDDGR